MPTSSTQMFSAGDCSVCSYMGAVIFLTSLADGRIFFGCPECGCAWEELPRLDGPEIIEPPDHFARDGFRLASRHEIEAAGLVGLIVDDHYENSGSGFDGMSGYRP